VDDKGASKPRRGGYGHRFRPKATIPGNLLRQEVTEEAK